jgi:hypothetical protein
MDNITIATTTIGSIVAVSTLVNGVWQYRRKVPLEIFRTYADRYSVILPPERYDVWHAALKGDQERWPELTPTMINYLNLVWEEFFLSQQGVIPRKLWRLWLPQIRNVLSTEFARTVMATYNFHFPPQLTCKH